MNLLIRVSPTQLSQPTLQLSESTVRGRVGSRTFTAGSSGCNNSAPRFQGLAGTAVAGMSRSAWPIGRHAQSMSCSDVCRFAAEIKRSPRSPGPAHRPTQARDRCARPWYAASLCQGAAEQRQHAAPGLLRLVVVIYLRVGRTPTVQGARIHFNFRRQASLGERVA
jgi:hypothetical protein